MRDQKIDICKGIGIVLMVLGHAGMPYSSVVFRFHMALFFILSGYLFSEKKVNDIKGLGKYILRKIKTLYIPFILWNGFLVLMNNPFIRLGIYTDNPLFLEETGIAGAAGNWYGIKTIISQSETIDILKHILLFNWEQQLGGATWFLRVMFGVTILWALVTFLTKMISKQSETVQWIIQSLVAAGLLILSNMYQKNGINGLPLQFETIAASYIMFYFGYYFKQWKFQEERQIINQNRIKGMILAISFTCLICCDRVCNLLGWNSNINNYNDWTMYIISSISGFLCIYLLADFMIQGKNKIMKKIISFITCIGKKSIYILILHFLAFKTITAIQLVKYHQPSYRLASFPCFNNSGLWWIAYTIAGVAIPVLIGFGFEKIKRLCTNRKEIKLGQ